MSAAEAVALQGEGMAHDAATPWRRARPGPPDHQQRVLSGGDWDAEPAAVLARKAMKRRADRRRHFGSVLGQDGIWNMLLELLTAQAEGRAISKKCLWLASGLPQSTAVRWVSYLISRGVVTERNDPADGRRQLIEIDPEFAHGLALFIAGTER